MISNELLEEIINISLKDEFITQDLLLKIIDSIIMQCDSLTKSNLNGVRIFKQCNRKYTNAEYMETSKIINIYYLNVIKNGLIRKKLNIFETNIYLIQTILHEIEHLKESTKAINNEFENKLLKNSSTEFVLELLEDNLNNFMWYHKDSKLVKKYIIKKYSTFYRKYWDIFPDEKIAEADSNKILLDSINKYDKFQINYKKEYEFISMCYLNSLLTGYIYKSKENKYSIPLKHYLETIKSIDILEKTDPTIIEEINNFNNYTLEERMKYGFPITKEGIKKVKEKILTISTI